jgi:hypothetical protein
VRELFGLLLASLVAGLATTLYAAYHTTFTGWRTTVFWQISSLCLWSRLP